MNTVTLLKELFGEEPIKKVVNSGFDTVEKIAAASPESLAFFAGIHEALAKQIIASAEESAKASGPEGYRAALSGAAPLPVAPRSATAPSDASSSKARSESTSKGEKSHHEEDFPEPTDPTPGSAPSTPLDVNPRLDAGQILRSVASERCAEEINAETALLEGLGLSDAETLFLDGESPWSQPAELEPHPVGAAGNPEVATLSPEKPSSPGGGEKTQKPVEWAPVSDWSPEKDPDPVPRVVRAPELGPDSNPDPVPEPSLSESNPEKETEPAAGVPELPSKQVSAGERPPKLGPKPEAEAEASKTSPPTRLSLWRFGK